MAKRSHSSSETEQAARKRKPPKLSSSGNAPKGRGTVGEMQEAAAAAAQEVAALQEVDRILERLDREIPEAHQRMDALLSRLRTTRIAA